MVKLPAGINAMPSGAGTGGGAVGGGPAPLNLGRDPAAVGGAAGGGAGVGAGAVSRLLLQATAPASKSGSKLVARQPRRLQ